MPNWLTEASYSGHLVAVPRLSAPPSSLPPSTQAVTAMAAASNERMSLPVTTFGCFSKSFIEKPRHITGTRVLQFQPSLSQFPTLS